MTTTAENVFVAGTGYVAYAPLGTALPTDATSTINALFEDVGYVSDAGVGEDYPRDTNDIVAWQNADVVRTKTTKHSALFDFELIESNDTVATLYYGDPDQITGADHVHHAFIIEVQDGSDIVRYCIPDGQVTSTGKRQHVNADASKFPITITAFPDSNDVKVYRYVTGGVS